MKKTNMLSAFALILCLTACTSAKFGIVPLPENSAPAVSSRTIQLENSLSPSIGLDATEYSFGCPLRSMSFYPPQKQIVLVGTNEKKNLKENPVFLFKVDSGEIAWSFKTLSPNFNISTSANLPETIVFVGAEELFGVDSKNGQVVWQRPGNNISVGFSGPLAYERQNVEGNTQLQLFDARSGETLWARESLDPDFWGYQTEVHEDKTLFLYGDGLHSFDLQTGEGWDYEVDTHAIGGVGKVVAGQILSALSGVPAGTRIDHYTGLTSNLLISGDKIYYAGNRILVCVELTTGKEVWNIELPCIAAHSGISEEDGHILMIGFGWCYKNKVITDYSVPFVARFDKRDGKQLLYREVGLTSRINDYTITPEGYCLISGGKAILVDKNNPAAIIDPNAFAGNIPEKFSKSLGIVKNTRKYYVMDEGNNEVFRSLAELQTDDSDIWINTVDYLVQYDKHLSVKNRFPLSRLYFKIHENDSVLLIRGVKHQCAEDQKDHACRHKYIKIIDAADHKGQLLAEIKTELPCQIMDDSLVLWDNTRLTDKLIVLPLQNLTSRSSEGASSL